MSSSGREEKTPRVKRTPRRPAAYLGGGMALQVPDVSAAVTYYVEAFGFQLVEMDDQNRYAALRAGKVSLDLVDEHGAGTRAVGPPGEGVAMYVYVEDVPAQYRRMQKSKVPILTRVNGKPAGVEEFSVRDVYGLLWIFIQASSQND